MVEWLVYAWLIWWNGSKLSWKKGDPFFDYRLGKTYLNLSQQAFMEKWETHCFIPVQVWLILCNGIKLTWKKGRSMFEFLEQAKLIWCNVNNLHGEGGSSMVAVQDKVSFIWCYGSMLQWKTSKIHGWTPNPGITYMMLLFCSCKVKWK